MRVTTLAATVLALSAIGTPVARAAGPCSTSGSGTALSRAAAGLVEHEWCELATNLSAEIMKTCSHTGNHHINTYADSMAWDAVLKRVYFIGTPHMGLGKWLTYDAATNVWSAETLPAAPPIGCTVLDTCGDTGICSQTSHGYDHNAADPAGNFYFRPFSSGNLKRWDGSWNSMPPLFANNAASAIKYFPERSGLFFFIRNDEVRMWTKATDTWSSNLLADCTIDGAGYHLFAEYSPVHKLIWFGAGNGGVKSCTYRQDGSFSQEANSPVGLGVTNQLVSVDPAGGNFVVYSNEFGSWREYDPITNAWTSINWDMPPLWFKGSSGDAAIDNIEVAIPDYGLIMFVSYLGGSPKTFVYKHTQESGSGEVDPPDPPTNPQPF